MSTDRSSVLVGSNNRVDSPPGTVFVASLDEIQLSASSKRTKERPRERAFRKAIHLLSLPPGHPERPLREKIEPKGGQKLFDDIKCNRTSSFGLNSLSKLLLDERFLVDHDYFVQLTLLEYAVLLQSCQSGKKQRDGIIKALISAQSNPFHEFERGLASHLYVLPSRVAVWLCKHLVSMYLFSGVKGESRCNRCHCGVAAFDGQDRLRSRTACAWPTCGHLFCLECVSDVYLELSYAITPARWRAELVCPECGARQPDDQPIEEPLGSPDEEKEAALDRFLSLGSATQKTEKKPKMQGCSPVTLARLFLGTSMAERQQKFWLAVINDDCMRAASLLRAGVAVDAVNEYGQSALFLACWANTSRHMCQLLLNYGATQDRPCNLGLRCADLVQREQLRGLLSRPSYPPPRILSVQAALSKPPSTRITIKTLIPSDAQHPGAGALVVDGAFAPAFLEALDAAFACAPIAPKEKESCSDRRYICDSSGTISAALETALKSARLDYCTLPFMRFLDYASPGQSLPPHVDLARVDRAGNRSTHTFILYLSDCVGGETALLQKVMPGCSSNKAPPNAQHDDQNVLAVVQPCRGRLLVFPHSCPHEGRITVQVPKLLLRGELRSLHL